MHVLLIAAVMSNQLWFDTQTLADNYVITPKAMLAESCDCQLSIAVSHHAGQGQSTSRQQGSIKLAANQQQSLGQMRFSLQQGDYTQITVTLTDGNGLRVENQLTLRGNG